MNAIIRIRVLIALFVLMLCSTNSKLYAQQGGPVSYQEFYDQLSPYGDWVNDPDYGYAWVPDAGPDFQPYRSHGHWVYTEYGWTWVSDYKWGWAAFHYGRWRLTDEFGWIWIPGYTWGPAWVSWRRTEGYYGWAPLGPPRLRYEGPGFQGDNTDGYRDQENDGGYRDESNNGNYRDGYYDGNRDQNYAGSGFHVSIGFNFSWGNAAPVNQWCFVPANYVASPYLSNYYVPQIQNTTIYNNTTIIKNTYVNGNMVNNSGTIINNYTNSTNNSNNTISNSGNKTVYIAGPPRADVEKSTGQVIKAVAITNASKPGMAGIKGNAISMYRPPFRNPVEAGNIRSSAGLPAPSHAVPINQVSPIIDRSGSKAGLVRNNAISHLNSTDSKPLIMAKTNYSAFKSSPVRAKTVENQRYIKAGTVNTGRAQINRPENNLTPVNRGISSPQESDGGMNNPKDKRLEQPPVRSQSQQIQKEKDRADNENRIQEQNRLQLQNKVKSPETPDHGRILNNDQQRQVHPQIPGQRQPDQGQQQHQVHPQFPDQRQPYQGQRQPDQGQQQQRPQNQVQPQQQRPQNQVQPQQQRPQNQIQPQQQRPQNQIQPQQQRPQNQGAPINAPQHVTPRQEPRMIEPPRQKPVEEKK